jgi:hypothetical protein
VELAGRLRTAWPDVAHRLACLHPRCLDPRGRKGGFHPDDDVEPALEHETTVLA